jgi:hypothetical protein
MLAPLVVQIVSVVVGREVSQVRSRVELFEQIRRDRRLEQLSIRELAERHGVHRRAVRQALVTAIPPPRRTYPPRRRPAIDPWAAVIDDWLLADQDAPRKQRHTARRVWQRLVAEHQATLSEVTVSRYVARRRGELGLTHPEVSIPQTHLAGAEGEVDFGEFYASLAGENVKCWMFVMRLSHSGRAFHVTFGTQAREAFLEGHALAFCALRRCAGPGPPRLCAAPHNPGCVPDRVMWPIAVNLQWRFAGEVRSGT